MREAYVEATRGLIDGGADIILIETIFDTLNAKAAIHAVQDAFEETGATLPLMISGTLTDKSGRTLSGQTTEAFWNSVRHARPFAVGLNCALGAEEMRPYAAEISRIADTNICIYPNAGLPNEFGEYDQLADEMAVIVGEFATSGLVNILGGAVAQHRSISPRLRRRRVKPRHAHRQSPNSTCVFRGWNRSH